MSTSPRSSLSAVKRAPSSCRRSSSVNTACSAWASISRVRSPPSPRSPVSTTRSAMVGCSASISRIASAARRAAPSQSGVMWRPILGREVPTAAQHEAVTHARGPLLIVGGAGTGKTTTLVERFAWLAAEQVPAESILALAFGDAAAARLRERVEARLPGPPPEEPSITTFEGFCARLLREEALEAGLDPFATPVSAADRLAMLLERIDDLPLRHHDLRGNPSALLGSIVGRIDRLKDELVSAEDYAAWAATLPEDLDADRHRAAREREFAALYAAHDRMLADAGTLDFGDLVLHAFRLLRERPHVRARLAQRYRHLLVDEFQDTNFAQGLLLRLLAAEHGNVTVAADDDSSIHRFRGAATKNIHEFRVEWPLAKVVRLEESQRSGERILRAAAAVVAPNEERIDKVLR